MNTVQQLIKHGILAADESTGTIGKRLSAVGVENTEANRRAWRETLFTTTDIEKYISGVILYDETVRQGMVTLLSSKGILSGIKVDKGTKPFLDGLITEGLDGLRERLKEYSDLGLKFAKWRSVYEIKNSLPVMAANVTIMALYAKYCQEAGIVPIVEPEVLMSGEHDILDAKRFTKNVLDSQFNALCLYNVDLKNIVLKPNMVMYGYQHGSHHNEVVAATLEVLYQSVPHDVPGIAFLSGGQPDEDAVTHLRLLNAKKHPWRLTFSYGRGLQSQALKIWAIGDKDGAQKMLLEQSKRCYLASLGN